jgi:hypothetical protein
MQAAGIRAYSDPVEPLDLPDPGELRSDEVAGRSALQRPGQLGRHRPDRRLGPRAAAADGARRRGRRGDRRDRRRGRQRPGGGQAPGALAAGAAHVLDRRAPDWPGRVRRLTAGRGADLAVNAAPGGAADAITAVRDGGRLVTITSDPPAADRGIEVRQVYVAPDGPGWRGSASCSPRGRSGSRWGRRIRWTKPSARSPGSAEVRAARRSCCRCRRDAATSPGGDMKVPVVFFRRFEPPLYNRR